MSLSVFVRAIINGQHHWEIKPGTAPGGVITTPAIIDPEEHKRTFLETPPTLKPRQPYQALKLEALRKSMHLLSITPSTSTSSSSSMCSDDSNLPTPSDADRSFERPLSSCGFDGIHLKPLGDDDDSDEDEVFAPTNRRSVHGVDDSMSLPMEPEEWDVDDLSLVQPSSHHHLGFGADIPSSFMSMAMRAPSIDSDDDDEVGDDGSVDLDTPGGCAHDGWTLSDGGRCMHCRMADAFLLCCTQCQIAVCGQCQRNRL